MTTQEKILIFKGTEKQITEVLQPLNLLPINQIDFMKKALRHNLNVLQVEENIYLNMLKKQFKQALSKKEGNFYLNGYDRLAKDYLAMRSFCLDTQLLSSDDIEAMECEIGKSF